MDNQRIIYLYQAYLNGNINPGELEEFKQIVLDPDQEDLLLQQIEEHWNRIKEDPALTPSGNKLDEVFTDIVRHPRSAVRRIKLWPRIAAIASVAAMVVLGVYFFKYNHTDRDILALQNVAAGKVGATLTLASGKKIKLSAITNGEIAEEGGISVTKTADGQLVYQISGKTGETDKINTLSTGNGETFILTLPDQSKVWLNAASSLTYTTLLNEGGKRIVKLTGEAYFEISKDKAHPFIVESRGQTVEVLGTHFNVSSYADELNTRTTLLEGSVEVNKTLTLVPGEQAIGSGKSLTKAKTNIEQAVAWKEGYFRFDDEDLKSIMRELGRWYNVEIADDNYKSNEGFTGSISRSKPLGEVLMMLEKTKDIHLKVEGRRITIMD